MPSAHTPHRQSLLPRREEASGLSDEEDLEEISHMIRGRPLVMTFVKLFGIPANRIRTRAYEFTLYFPSFARCRCQLVGSRPFGLLTADEAERAVRWLLSLGLEEQGEDLFIRWAEMEARGLTRYPDTIPLS